ncbi:nucleotidyltransferase domain-containing protein [Chryseobacterium sp. EO14]|uniref:nucleotidyltransferase domain-containing protein n=1 Tax=Chryseobacterium sp. EO14 TaxID=2950551 RepID=UPI00210B57BE|nr:nucleotidyltransferase domain-containing protein [Chryseobacterium sp. EO14]MCQ4142450.1 hypothetical protein [Chryseobacterium sp. EO14]
MNTSKKEEIINTLKYFHFFKFPLTFEELHRYLHYNETEKKLKVLLKELISEEKVFEIENCYLLENNIFWVERKIKGKALANSKILNAKKNANIIYWFPFVRAVFISGSLSKGFADEHSDMDFFIITEKKRLWIARTLLHIFKKITFLFRKQHNFCMNYFIDSSELQLEEKNIFTAYEIATLIPCRGAEIYGNFIKANSWVLDFLPNNVQRNTESDTNKNKVKNFIEKIFNVFFGDILNRTLMEATDRLWRRKWSKKGFDTSQYDLAFKTRINISKNHEKNYQKLILKYNNKE